MITDRGSQGTLEGKKILDDQSEKEADKEQINYLESEVEKLKKVINNMRKKESYGQSG